jgi:hypothetical protein
MLITNPTPSQLIRIRAASLHPCFSVNQAATTHRCPFKLEDLVPLPALSTACGPGYGVAACPALGLLVTSDYHKCVLSVWALPGGAWVGVVEGASGQEGGGGPAVTGGGLSRLYTLGGDGSTAPMQFTLRGTSGHLAFTPFSGGSCSTQPCCW